VTVAHRGQLRRWEIVKIKYQFGILLARRLGVKGELMTVRRVAMLVLMLGVTVAITSCSSAVPTETPGVERLGQYILRAKGAQADVVVAYRYASLNLGNEWLLLEVALSSPAGQSAEFRREGIWVITPDGVRVPAASQKAFGEAFRTIQNQITQANVVRDPMDYFPPNRVKCSLQLYVAPGEGVVFDKVAVNDRRACEGKLFFYIPGGVQPGRYVLGMEVAEDEIRIPFTMEEK
jgi:hypothetical protein